MFSHVCMYSTYAQVPPNPKMRVSDPLELERQRAQELPNPGSSALLIQYHKLPKRSVEADGVWSTERGRGGWILMPVGIATAAEARKASPLSFRLPDGGCSVTEASDAPQEHKSFPLTSFNPDRVRLSISTLAFKDD